MSFSLAANHDAHPHEFRILKPTPEWLKTLAEEYVRDRTATTFPVDAMVVEGIGEFKSEAILRSLRRATVPTRGAGPLAVSRSDFGEVIGQYLLSSGYATRFAYKSLRDRELTQYAGRGIDNIGVEGKNPLTLVLGEVKVSAVKDSPPSVVDGGDDCLSKQHQKHLTDPEALSQKVMNASRHAVDPQTQRDLISLALRLEFRGIAQVDVVAYCALIRPECHCAPDDFGSFRESPDKYLPARIRFLIVSVPHADLEALIDLWLEAVNSIGESN